tara:strand:- start:570 stop:950 length:381 start_codon:yes stop_codon:yes gene_type:complete
MPPPLYCARTGTKYESKEEMLRMRRLVDNKKQKIRYWRNKYNYDITLDDYDKFNKISGIIRYIHDQHDFLMKFNPDDLRYMTKRDLDLYVKHHKFFVKAIPHLDYIKTLKKIEKKEPENDNFVVTF